MSEIRILKKEDIKQEFVNGLAHQIVFPNEYPGVDIYKCTLKAGESWKPALSKRDEKFQLFLFINQGGFIEYPSYIFDISDRAIFIPFFDQEEYTIHAGNTDLEFLHINSAINEDDLRSLNYVRLVLPKFKLLKDCWRYTGDFTGDAGSNLKSHYVVEHSFLGRCSMGWNLGVGPSFVGEHTHPDLEQWYYIFPGSTFTYTAGDVKVDLKGGDMTHTPIKTPHGSITAAGEKIDYVWFELAVKGYPLPPEKV